MKKKSQATEAKLLKASTSQLLEGLNKALTTLLQKKDFEQAIFDSLSIVGESTGSDGVFFSDDIQITSSTAILAEKYALNRINGAWQRIPTVVNRYQIAKAPQSEWLAKLQAGIPVHGRIDDFDESEQHLISGRNKNTFLLLLVAAEEEKMGVLIVGSIHQDRCWSGEAVQMLSSFALTLGSYFARRNAEQSLREKRDYLRKVMDLNPNLIFAKDRAGRYTLANKAMADTYGTTVKELIGKTDRDFNPNMNEVDRFLADNETVFQTRQPKYISHYTLTDLSGRTRHAQASKVPIVQADGEVEEILVVITDITRQKEAEERIREKEQLNRTILDTIPDILLVVRLETQEYTYLNIESRQEVFGYSIPEIKSHFDFFDTILHPNAKLGLPHFLNRIRCAANEDIIEAEYQVQHANGLWLWLYERAKVFRRTSDGQVIEYIAFIQDITAQKNAQDRIRESEEIFRGIFEQSPIGITFSNPERGIIKVNKRFSEMLGYEAHELIGKDFAIFSHPDDTKIGGLAREAAHLEGLDHCRYEKRFIHKDGRVVWADVAVTTIWDEESRPGFFFGMIEDVTALRQNLQELDEKNRELKRYIESNMQLENFAYIASHDLREPLRTIKNFSQLLVKRYAGILDASGREYLQFVTGSAGRLNDLIEDLLTYSKVTAIDNEREKILTMELIRQVKDALAGIMEEKSAVITEEHIPDIIYGDPLKIRQLFQNLISNAIKFQRPGVAPEVCISAREEPDSWRFTVSDNGIGIPEEFYERIFLLFKRLHNRETYEGTGLGLAISKKIVEQHGGEIGVESSLGKGSTFWFTISK